MNQQSEPGQQSHNCEVKQCSRDSIRPRQTQHSIVLWKRMWGRVSSMAEYAVAKCGRKCNKVGVKVHNMCVLAVADPVVAISYANKQICLVGHKFAIARLGSKKWHKPVRCWFTSYRSLCSYFRVSYVPQILKSRRKNKASKQTDEKLCVASSWSAWLSWGYCVFMNSFAVIVVVVMAARPRPFTLYFFHAVHGGRR